VSGADPDPGFWRGRAVSVTGGAGFLGRATVAMLEDLGADVGVVRSTEHDLREEGACREALSGAEVVIHLAAKVGGIAFNRRNPASLFRDNMLMGVNVFEACRGLGVAKLVAACSVCAYPARTPVPFSEDALWDGYPEESNAPYGLAKRMLIPLSETYRREFEFSSCIPVLANLYGPGDNFDLEDSHVIPGMIRRFLDADQRGDDEVTLWGTGEPTREFLYVDDAARALILAAERYDSSEPVNVGSGSETRIRDLAETIAELVGFTGRIAWDSSRPDGERRRRLDVSRARERFGFEARVPLGEGLPLTIESFRAQSRAPAA
jgi:GDP-L-fucose synthase